MNIHEFILYGQYEVDLNSKIAYGICLRNVTHRMLEQKKKILVLDYL